MFAEVLKLFTTSFDRLPYDYLELFAFFLLGCLAGLLGALLIFFIHQINLFRQRVSWLNSHRSRFLQVLVITALTVMVAFPLDFLVASQKTQINHMFNDLPYAASWNFDDAAAFSNLFLLLCWKVHWFAFWTSMKSTTDLC